MSLRAELRAQVGRLDVEVELTLNEDAPLLLVGPSGAGKTSLLKLLLGVLPVERGFIRSGNAVLLDTGARRVIPLEERRFGYVPQGYALFPHLDVHENVAFGLSLTRQTSRKQRGERVEELLVRLGLEGVARQLPGQLSGGEQQRVSLARALAPFPRALLLDEPLAALDVSTRLEVRDVLASAIRELRIPTLIVTHDAEDARALGGKILALEEGRVTQAGAWEELAKHPATPFVSKFVAS